MSVKGTPLDFATGDPPRLIMTKQIHHMTIHLHTAAVFTLTLHQRIQVSCVSGEPATHTT